MLKKIFLLTITSIVLLFVLTILKLEANTSKNTYFNPKNIYEKFNIPNAKSEIEQNSSIGKLIIKKININHNLYDINHTKNNVEQNITILKNSTFPPQENSIIFIAAHSGEGKLAYFKDLDNLNKNDEIILIYKNNKYIYKVKDMWEEPKNGYINVPKENIPQLILTTCSPNKKNKQLVINCIKKN